MRASTIGRGVGGQQRRPETWIALAIALLVGGGTACNKESPKEKTTAQGQTAPAASEPLAAKLPPPKVDVAGVAKKIGVEPGEVVADRKTGPAAILSSAEGGVTVRHLGQETFAPAQAKQRLRTGDQLRTGPQARATVLLADHTVVELAERTSLAIGDRNAGPRPASSASVLYGIARFSVSPRGKGEGAFLAYAPPGIVATKGTTYGIGVAASGDARIGVETGSVEVAGGTALATPVQLSAGNYVTIDAHGKVGAPQVFAQDDWGQWRAQADGKLAIEASAELHAQQLRELQAKVEQSFVELEKLTAASVEASAKAEGYAEAKDLKAYQVSAESRGATIEASFLASLQLQYLTAAMLSHAYILGELYLASPAMVEAVYVPAAPAVYGAILYQKKFHAVAELYVAPLRPAYYVHVPAGRVDAVVVGQVVPAFYARAKLEPLPPTVIQKQISFDVYPPPAVTATAGSKVVWVSAPKLEWEAKVNVQPAVYRQATRYVSGPPAAGASLLASATVTTPPWFVSGAGTARVLPEVKVDFGLPERHRMVVIRGGGTVKARLGGGGDATIGAATPGRIEAPPSPAPLPASGAAAGSMGGGFKVGVRIGGSANLKAGASATPPPAPAVPPPPPPPTAPEGKAGFGFKASGKAGVKLGGQ